MRRIMMENNKKKFIFTDNPKTAEYLRKNGFKQISCSEYEYIFLNNPNKCNFEKLEGVAFTNKLNL